MALRWRVAYWICLALLAIACLACWRPNLAGSGWTPPLVHLPASGQTGSGAAVATGGGVSPVRQGKLVLQIRWPDRDRPGFRAALIPTTTEAIAVWVRAGTRELLDPPRIVQRQPGEATVSVEIVLPEAINLSIEARAYRQANPDVAVDPPIARGFAAGVNIVAGRANPVRLALDALIVPGISNLSTNFAVPGTPLILTGTHFDVAAGASLSVTFDGTPALSVQLLSSSSVQVVVPEGATSGRVVVTNDGVPSTSEATFWVVNAFDVDAPRETWDPSPAGKRIVVAGQSLPFHGVPTGFAARSEDVLAALGASPNATMSVSGILDNPAAGTFPASGSFLAGAADATASLSAKAYAVTSSNALTLAVERVVSSHMDPGFAAVSLLGSPSVPMRLVEVLSGGASVPSSDLESSDTSRVVAQGGSVRVADGLASDGFVVITGRSALVPGKTATASVAAISTVTTTTVTTLAGGPFADGTATQAKFLDPWGIAVDAAGNFYVADTGNNRIRKVASDGTVTTLAGSGIPGFADGPARQARFSEPSGVALDAAGNLYVADRGNSRIRKVAPDGTVSTLAGGSGEISYPYGIAVSASGDVFVTEPYYNRIRKVRADGTVSTLAGGSGEFSYPYGVAVDAGGNVYVADTYNQRIRKVAADGGVSTVAGGNGEFNYPYGVAVSGAGVVYVADSYNNRIRKVASNGSVTTLAGGNGEFYDPKGVAVDGAGTVYVADTDNHRIRGVYSWGSVWTVAGSGTRGFADGTGRSGQPLRGGWPK